MPFDASAEDEIRRFEEQYRKQPESLVFARLADACRKAGDPQRALVLLEEGIARHPDYLSAHIVQARTFRDLGRDDEACVAFERVLELDGRNLVAIRGLADVAWRRGDRDEERRWLGRLGQADPFSPEAAERLAELEPAEAGTSEEPDAEAAGPAPDVEPVAWGGPETGEVGAEDEPEGPREGNEEAPEPGTGIEAGEGAGREPSPPAEVDRLPDPWWFESSGPHAEEAPEEVDEVEEDADLLTRTMAELYARQGLLDEAEAIYRELLRDRPGDEELGAGLDVVLGMRAARSAARGTPAPVVKEEPESGERTPLAAEASTPPGPTVGEALRELVAEGRELAARLPEVPAEEPTPAVPSEGSAGEGPALSPEMGAGPRRPVLEDWLRGLRA